MSDLYPLELTAEWVTAISSIVAVFVTLRIADNVAKQTKQIAEAESLRDARRSAEERVDGIAKHASRIIEEAVSVSKLTDRRIERDLFYHHCLSSAELKERRSAVREHLSRLDAQITMLTVYTEASGTNDSNPAIKLSNQALLKQLLVRGMWLYGFAYAATNLYFSEVTSNQMLYPKEVLDERTAVDTILRIAFQSMDKDLLAKGYNLAPAKPTDIEELVADENDLLWYPKYSEIRNSLLERGERSQFPATILSLRAWQALSHSIDKFQETLLETIRELSNTKNMHLLDVYCCNCQLTLELRSI